MSYIVYKRQVKIFCTWEMARNLFLWYLPFSILVIRSGRILERKGMKDMMLARDMNCVILSMHS